MSTYKYNDYVTNWPWPPQVTVKVKTVTNVQEPWPFPKSPPEETLGEGAHFSEADADLEPAVITKQRQADQAQDLVQELIAEGVGFCHVMARPHTSAWSSEMPFRGMTIAFRKCGEWKNSRMVEVAVVYCSQHDNFSKKVGNRLAAEKFANGETVMVPARTQNCDDFVIDNLKSMFWYSLVP